MAATESGKVVGDLYYSRSILNSESKKVKLSLTRQRVEQGDGIYLLTLINIQNKHDIYLPTRPLLLRIFRLFVCL